MKVNTEAFITALTERVNTILTTTYEEAPTKNAPPIFAVVSGINIIDLESGDLASFYIAVRSWRGSRRRRMWPQGS